MISRRKFIQGLTLTAAGLLIPETISRVFYSIPKVVVPQNLSYLDLLTATMKETVADFQKSLDDWVGDLCFGKDNWYIDGTDIVQKGSVFRIPNWEGLNETQTKP